MKKNIWVVIIAYNPQPIPFKELLQVLNTKNIVIVDNSASHKFVESCNTHMILNKSNMGFAFAVNQGMRFALERGAEWIVILNQDIGFTPKDVEKLDKHLTTTSTQIVGPVAGRLDSKRWTTILNNSGSRIDYITASCIAIQKSVIEKIGIFYEPYFMYYEDVDYCIRAKKEGFMLEKVSLSSFKHDESSAIGKNSIRHNYYLARNHLLFVQRQAPIAIKLYELLRIPKTLYESYKSKNKGAQLGIKDFFFRIFGMFSYNL